MRYDERPVDRTPVHTDDLPPLPQRDRTIPASAWVEAPESLRRSGDDLPGAPEPQYKRRIGPWLLWRAGPATKADARYWAARDHELDQPDRMFTFRLHVDGSGTGAGPSGRVHDRFRTWKEDLRDHP